MKAQHRLTITKGFEKFGYPKHVDNLRAQDLDFRQKALLCATELLSTTDSAYECIRNGESFRHAILLAFSCSTS